MGIMWFNKPAETWNKALPIGNGRLGAMVFGGQEQEIIQMNQDSIWYGAPVDRINPDARGHLDTIRKLILEGRIPEAEDLLRYTFSGTPQSQRPYQPLGNVEITYHGNQGEVSNYRRELDLENGMVTEVFGINECNIRKKYLASYPHGIIAICMTAEEGTISFDAILRRGRFYEHAGKMDEQTIYMDGTLGEGGIAFLTALRAQTTGGSVQVLGEHLLVRDAREVTLYISCETSFYCEDYRELVGKKLDAACETGYQVIEKKHCEDYRELYGAVTLELEGEYRNISDIPIDQRLRKLKEEDNDNQLAAVYFQYGRYLLISSSRPGSLPANLQGIWNDEMIPAWDSKFTININTQMNYWPAEICSLSQCHLPLFDHLLRMWERGKETAGRMYGCRGFVAHHNTDIWGDCAPQDIYIPASYWVMGGAWLCTHIWTHYIYTGDMEFLRRMYPIFKDSVIFFHDYLIENHGEMVTCPSVSPENTYILPDGTKGCVCAGSSMDNQILRDLMEGYLKASEALGIQDEDMDKTREILNKIPVTKIGKYGQIMEWREDYEEEEPGHRHISQLYALHPSHQITVDKTPELTRAAANTLERRLSYGGGHTGWSCAWIVNLYARLGEGDKALENLNKLWRQSTFPNLMDNHPRRDSAVFQIDGNFGATAAIAEMLVQSDEDRVLLLPALPEKWKCGKVTGLTIVGGARLDIQWAEGRLTECTIRSERDMEIVLVYGQEKRKVSVKARESLTVKGAVV